MVQLYDYNIESKKDRFNKMISPKLKSPKGLFKPTKSHFEIGMFHEPIWSSILYILHLNCELYCIFTRPK